MRAHASVVLDCGFRGIEVDLPMTDNWLSAFDAGVRWVDWDDRLQWRENLGAATLVVQLQSDAGQPAGWLSWRHGAVLYRNHLKTRLGSEQGPSLLDWFEDGIANRLVDNLPPSWRSQLRTEVSDGERPIQEMPPAPATSPQCESAQANWQTGPWDDVTHNCYSYACGARSGLMVPGQGAGSPITPASSAGEIVGACKRDGLHYLEEGLPGNCYPEGHFIAIVWRPPDLRGFHCFRLNRDGKWSHKDGPSPARPDDHTFREMHNLQTAQFHYGEEFKFVGYFHCPPGHLVK